MQSRYKIVSTGDKWSLAEKVNAAIAEGWVPQGGVALWKTGGLSLNEEWVQAMVRWET